MLDQDAADSLPAPVVDFLDGADLDSKLGETVLLTAVDGDSWPRVALLSVGEVVSAHPREVRLLLWRGSRTARALASSGRGQLLMVVGRDVFKIYLAARQAGAVTLGDREYRIFRGSVATVERDSVGYAHVTSGITYRLPDPERVLRRWRAQVKLLLNGGFVNHG